jgi:hypothetical protein
MKQRIYKLEYWFGTTLMEQYMPFKNYSEAFRYLYSRDLKVLNVTFQKWENWG